MSVFFNGRLWVSPAVMSVVDDSAMYDRNLSIGNVMAIIGRSVGGAPLTALRFGSPQEARDVLKSGELLKAISKAFDPSPETVAPQTIVAIRVNPATRSTLTLNDSLAAAAIVLTSTDYGAYTVTNGLKVKVEDGTTKGKKVTTAIGNSYYAKDNIYRDALAVQYGGAEASATVQITSTQCILCAPALTPVATINLSECPTVQQLADRINVVADFTATVGPGEGPSKADGGLDVMAAAQACKAAAYTVTGNVQAVVDWFNGLAEGYVDAERATPLGSDLANVGYTNLTGGTDGVVTNTEWQSAFDALQAEDVQWVVPLSDSAAVHAMADTHVAYMSNVGRMERRAFVGGAVGVSDADAKTAAHNLNSDRTAYVHLGYYDYDENGTLVLYPPYQTAVLVAAGFAGLNPGSAMTNKALKVRGLERKLRNPTDTDGLITEGVLCVEDLVRGSAGYKVVRSVSTWVVNTNYNRVEVSVGAALDFTSRNVRAALERFKGSKGSPQTITLAVEIVKSVLTELALPEPMGPAVLVGDEINPAFKNIVGSIVGDVLRIEFQCSPVIPINYVPVVIHAVPWSGKVIAPAT